MTWYGAIASAIAIGVPHRLQPHCHSALRPLCLPPARRLPPAEAPRHQRTHLPPQSDTRTGKRDRVLGIKRTERKTQLSIADSWGEKNFTLLNNNIIWKNSRGDLRISRCHVLVPVFSWGDFLKTCGETARRTYTYEIFYFVKPILF